MKKCILVLCSLILCIACKDPPSAPRHKPPKADASVSAEEAGDHKASDKAGGPGGLGMSYSGKPGFQVSPGLTMTEDGVSPGFGL